MSDLISGALSYLGGGMGGGASTAAPDMAGAVSPVSGSGTNPAESWCQNQPSPASANRPTMGGQSQPAMAAPQPSATDPNAAATGAAQSGLKSIHL